MENRTKTLLVAGVILVAACFVATAVLVVAHWPVTPVAAPPTGPAMPAGTAYQVYFTTPKYPDRESDHRGSLDEKLTSLINMAQSSVDMAIYQLDLPTVTQALLNAKKRGVAVRLVTDVDILNDPEENASFKQLQTAGIPVVAGNPNAIMHNKFVIVDGAAVWTGSWNFTVDDTYRYDNNAILIRSRELARNYVVTFDKMFQDKRFGASRQPGGTRPRLTIDGLAAENFFAPEDGVANRVTARIARARQSIDFMAYSFTDDAIGGAVRERSKAGVKVRGVFEKTGSATQFSEYGAMRKQGMDVWPDGNPYLMHHKVFIVDGETLILGSFNFSQDADKENDENLLVIDDPALARSFQPEFTRVYEQAKAPPVK